MAFIIPSSVALSEASGHTMFWNKLSSQESDVQEVEFRVCTPFAGWAAVGFNPSVKGMTGAEIFEGTKLSGNWEVTVRTAPGRTFPATGGVSSVSDVTDAAVACGTEGYEFKASFASDSSMAAELNVITAWSEESTASLGYHGTNRNVSLFYPITT